MKFKAKAGQNNYTISDLTLGQLLAIRNGIGQSVRGGIATPVQYDVYEAVGRYLQEIAQSVPDVKEDPEGFLKDHYGITLDQKEGN